MAASSGDGGSKGKKGGRRHVYRSGATGCGGGGPVQVDKRMEERPCPYCDRVFKQVGRWQDHLQKKHPQEHQEQLEKEKQEKREEQPSSAYPQKTPRQFLHDWCQKNKRPNPKYSPREETGPDDKPRWKCKVALPSTKAPKDDIVRFTQRTYETKEEAMQRAALAALQHVMGGRSMHVILPHAYREEWLDLERQSKERSERQEKNKEVKEGKKEREKRHADRAARQAPQVVVMTEERRKEVEEALKGVRGRQIASIKTSSSQDVPGDAGKLVAEELVALGFRVEDVNLAIAALEDRGAIDLEPAIDWICLHADERHLPRQYAPLGASGAPVRVLHSAEQDEQERLGENPDLYYLVSCGYPVKLAESALESAHGNRRVALSSLYDKLAGIPTGGERGDGVDETWEEECWVLRSVYGEDMEYIPPGLMTIALDCSEDQWEDTGGDTSVQVDVFKPLSGTYPHALPTLALRSPALTPGQRLLLTKYLAEASKKLVGDVMVFALLDQFSQLYFEVKSQEISASSLLSDTANTTRTKAINDQPKQRKTPGNIAGRSSRTHGKGSSQLENDRLLEWHRRLESCPSHAFMRKIRQGLPAYQKREATLELIRDNLVLVLSGETGCGKSTQLPQYILEEAIENGRGSSCNIICTQPRRISAIGLASRVAAERAESVGEVVGYSVRLENRSSPKTRLLYCTTGVLLRRLLNDPSLSGTTHIVVDEVHERSLDSDLLLLLLRDLLVVRPDLKLILMSATANADLFAAYFEKIPRCRGCVAKETIPGFTFPVQDFFLEDIVEAFSYRPTHRSGTFTKGDAQRPRGASERGTKSPASLHGYQESTVESLRAMSFDSIDYELLEHTISFLCTREGPALLGSRQTADLEQGALLVFLPGAAEISRLKTRLASSTSLSNALGSSSKVQIYALHGAMQSSEQQAVFQKQKKGVRKIVIATNVAETSITIDDVTCVIDTGKHKEMTYDAERGVATLKEAWVSKASARQRRGRAGRVCAGVCLKLYTRSKHDSLEEYQEPEIRRVPLESLCLQVKKILGGSIRRHLNLCLSPPANKAVEEALSNLVTAQAIDREGELTPLGQHLSLMPVDVHIGKMLVYGVLLRCLDPILTIAAALSGHWPFLSTLGRDDEDRKARNQLAGASNQSDHLAVVAAYNGWLRCKTSSKKTSKASREFCEAYLLSEQALVAIHKLRHDLASVLADVGFLPRDLLRQLNSNAVDGEGSSRTLLSDFGDVGRIVKAVICAAFYPKLVRVEHPATKYKQTQGGTVAEEASPQSIKFFTRDLGRVFVHPSSVNFSSGRFESGWLVYTNIVQTSKVFVRESSMVPAYAILFFGGAITVKHDEGLVLVDQWAKFRAPARIAVLVRELRAEVDSLLLSKISSPTLELSDSPVVEVLLGLLQNNGF